MSFTKINRRKTAMLIHQLEESLGQYIIEQQPELDMFSEKAIENILERSRKNVNITSIEELIAATSFTEIFYFLLEITKENSLNKHIKDLEKMFQDYNISDIRNIISHSNRVFLDEYWYKVATIASSTLIEIIGLKDVKEALLSAEAGTIEDPPDEWLDSITTSLIPNNLPSEFEHSITELVGRKNEEKELLESLKNPRIFTTVVVAAGGIGKTALVLDILGRLIYDVNATMWCDGIIFIDMKLEKLTTKGVQSLEAIETIEEVKKNIVQEINMIFNDSLKTIVEVYEKYNEKKLLIFIDNLETLIRDSQKSFDEFSLSLPINWRLLVTSRIILIGNANIIPLKNLQEKLAIHLARTYAIKRGKINLDSSQYKQIAKSCHFNPLAIKLTIDLYVSGEELPLSINKSSEMVAEFSYINLIEKLSEESIQMLEALFTQPDIDRADLHNVLELSLEDITQSINELSKTSLILRKSTADREYFSLSSSIRELLLISPRNIEVRHKIQKKLLKTKDMLLEINRNQEERGIDELNEYFIPYDINDRLKIAIRDLNQSFQDYRIISSKASKLLQEFNSLKEICKNEYIYFRSLGRLYRGLGDNNQAITSFQQAIQIDKKDYLSIYLLGDTYFRNKKDYPKAEEVYYSLLTIDGFLGKNKGFSKKILHGYFLSLLYQHKYQEVLDKTKNWKNRDNILKGILGTYHASAWRRKLETISFHSEEYCEAMNNSINTFIDLFDMIGYPQGTSRQAKKLIEDIEYNIEKNIYESCDKLKWLNFIFNHSDAIFGINNENSKLITKLSKLNIQNNPFKNKMSIYDFGNKIDKNNLPEKYMIVSISWIPNLAKFQFPNYLFAIDINQKRYIIYFSSLLSQNWEDWSNLSEGVELGVLVDLSVEHEKSIPSLETVILL